MSKLSRQERRNLRKKKRRRRILLVIFLPMLLLAAGAGLYIASLAYKAGFVLDGAYNPLEREARTGIKPNTDNVSVLIMDR